MSGLVLQVILQKTESGMECGWGLPEKAWRAFWVGRAQVTFFKK